MKRRRSVHRLGSILVFMAMVAATAPMAGMLDQGEIRFARGADSGSVSGAVIRGERDRYSLVASAGQWLEVEIDALEENAVFQLSIHRYGTGEEVALAGARDGEDAKHWYGRLPLPGYSRDGRRNAVTIVVGGTRGNATYDLTVTIRDHDWLANDSAGVFPPKAGGDKYRNLLQTLHCPRDRGRYGEFTDYGYWRGGAWCGQRGEAGYWVWEYPNWYVWAEKADQPPKPPQSSPPGKVMSGTVTSMEVGDVACYVDFRGDDGRDYSELANFEVCEAGSLIGKRVRFEYSQGRVIAADCEGDPECGRGETVWLISDIRER